MTLISLYAHNEKAGMAYYKARTGKPKPNGLGCPDCGSELLDTSQDIMLLTSPPKLNVHCSHCEFKGFRVL